MGVFAMMLLIVHVAIAAANLAEDKCAALRAQNAQLVAQLASCNAELSRLRSELAAIRSVEASSGRVLGTQRHLLETGGADTRSRESDACMPARVRVTHSFPAQWILGRMHSQSLMQEWFARAICEFSQCFAQQR